MFDKLVPDKYYKSIYDIDYASLKKIGIKCLIFGITNTLVPEGVNKPTNKVKDLFEDLKEMGFKIVIVSNESKKWVTPFKENLCVDASYLSFKPFKRKYKKVLKYYNLQDYEVASIGCQLLFDIYGANKMNFTSILVNPISNDEYTVTRFYRKIENKIVNHLTKKNLFKRGRYYE